MINNMIKVLVKKKLNEDAPAQAAAPAALPAQVTQQNQVANAQGDTNVQYAPVIDAKAFTDALSAFSDGIAKQIQAACAQEALAKAMPQLLEAAKIDTYKQQIDAINKAMSDIKGAQTSQDIITKYGELLGSLNNLSKAAIDQTAQLNQVAQPATTQPAATQPTASQPAATQAVPVQQ